MSKIPNLPPDRAPRPEDRRVSGVIYGPVRSRRFGLSLGINVSGSGKHCSFSCPYCFRGANDGRPDLPGLITELPRPSDVREALRSAISDPEIATALDWTLAGNAEPTDHPEIPEIISVILEERDRLAPRALVSVLSNGMGLVPRYSARHLEIAEALTKVDRACLKLDAATPRTWRRLSGAASGVTLEEWLDAARALPSPILQIMLVRGLVDNTTEPEISALEERIRWLGAREIQVVTADRPPMDSRVEAVPANELEHLARRLRAAASRAPATSQRAGTRNEAASGRG